MVLCGFLVPSEAEKQANFNSDIKINYGLLDIKPETIKERLTKRGWNENKIVYHIE
jgi:broad-specificity NMP kinase